VSTVYSGVLGMIKAAKKAKQKQLEDPDPEVSVDNNDPFCSLS
jgi:hypothetical protein